MSRMDGAIQGLFAFLILSLFAVVAIGLVGQFGVVGGAIIAAAIGSMAIGAFAAGGEK